MKEKPPTETIILNITTGVRRSMHLQKWLLVFLHFEPVSLYRVASWIGNHGDHFWKLFWNLHRSSVKFKLHPPLFAPHWCNKSSSQLPTISQKFSQHKHSNNNTVWPQELKDNCLSLWRCCFLNFTHYFWCSLSACACLFTAHKWSFYLCIP